MLSRGFEMFFAYLKMILVSSWLTEIYGNGAPEVKEATSITICFAERHFPGLEIGPSPICIHSSNLLSDHLLNWN